MCTPAAGRARWAYGPTGMTFTGIQSASDISAALKASVERGGLVLDEKNLSPDFFDLKTGLAGQVLQKFVSYRTKLAVIVRDPSIYGGRFGELMHEHRIHPTVRFFVAEQPARQWLSQMPSGKC
jgi:uncharacterized protein DUF4180